MALEKSAYMAEFLAVLGDGSSIRGMFDTSDSLDQVDALAFAIHGPMALTNPTTAPTATGSATGGSLAAGTYTYEIGFGNSLGTTPPGPASVGYAATGTTSSVALTAIPLGPAGTTSRQVYRSLGGGAYALVGTIADNTTTTFTDTGFAAGAAAPTTNTTATTVQHIYFDDELWNGPETGTYTADQASGHFSVTVTGQTEDPGMTSNLFVYEALPNGTVGHFNSAPTITAAATSEPYSNFTQTSSY